MALLTTLPDNFTTLFSRTVAAALIAAYPANFAGITADAVAAKMQSLIPALFPQTLSLVRTRPDYESVMAQLLAEVERSEVWADSDISGTGQMLLRAIAADVDYGQFSIARALQEAYLDTARSDSAIFLAARTLGNRLTRNLSASVQLNVSRPQVYPDTGLTMAAYSTWVINFPDIQVPYFCRDVITLNPDIFTGTITLYQGTVNSSTITSSGVAFQSVEIGNETRTISDVDLVVTVDGVQWTRVTDPLWHFGPTDQVYWENTTAVGNVEIRFGDGLTGASPAQGVNIFVQWVENLGSQANRSDTGNFASPTLSFSLNALTGTTTTAPSGGTDYLSSRFFKLFGSSTNAARKRAVRRGDYRAMALTFGSPIKDVGFRGQAEIAPNRPSFTNVTEATLLCDPPLQDADWTRFVAFMDNIAIWRTQMRRTDPTALPMNITAQVFCLPEANLADVGTQLISQITAAFAPSYGSLGFSWYLSDVTGLLESANTPLGSLISYSVLSSPTAPVICSDLQEWVKLASINLSLLYTTRGPYAGRKDQAALQLAFDAVNGLQVG